MKFKFFVGILLALAIVVQAQGQDSGGKWSVETSLTFPMVSIYMLKVSYQITERSEVGIGPAFQNWKNMEEEPLGQANAYTLLLSYRFYFWRNFHTEIELWPAYNRFESNVDGKTYSGLELWAEYKVGYKINLLNDPNLYLAIQPGIGQALWMQKRRPGMGEKTQWDLFRESIIFIPQVVVGFKF